MYNIVARGGETKMAVGREVPCDFGKAYCWHQEFGCSLLRCGSLCFGSLHERTAVLKLNFLQQDFSHQYSVMR